MFNLKKSKTQPNQFVTSDVNEAKGQASVVDQVLTMRNTKTQRKKKSVLDLTEVFKNKLVADYNEQKCQQYVCLFRSLMFNVSDLRSGISETSQSGTLKPDEQMMGIKSKCDAQVKIILSKITDLINGIRCYDDERVTFDDVLSNLNAFVSTVMNLKVKYNETEAGDRQLFIQISQGQIIKHAVALCNSIQQQLVCNLAFLLLEQKIRDIKVSADLQKKKLKILKVLSGFQNYFSTNTDKSLIKKGFLAKKSKNQGTFTKNWKRQYFTLYEDKLIYADKENVAEKDCKVILTAVITSVLDVSKENMKSHCFQICAQNNIVLQAADENEFKLWVDAIQQVIESNEISAINSASQSAQVEPKLDWRTFREVELRDIVKSMEHEEKYQIEMTKLTHLYKIKDVLQTVNTKEIVEQIEALNQSETADRVREYSEEKLIREKFSQLLEDRQQFLEFIVNNKTLFLSEISGLYAKDMEL
ncbi:hypothetical protein MP228_001351 [Amoeboaphelidium protococcarum]|nr:hypothetical protein MP228_001351 [Amoeboaphelidium protococcarum]